MDMHRLAALIESAFYNALMKFGDNTRFPSNVGQNYWGPGLERGPKQFLGSVAKNDVQRRLVGGYSPTEARTITVRLADGSTNPAEVQIVITNGVTGSFRRRVEVNTANSPLIVGVYPGDHVTLDLAQAISSSVETEVEWSYSAAEWNAVATRAESFMAQAGAANITVPEGAYFVTPDTDDPGATWTNGKVTLAIPLTKGERQRVHGPTLITTVANNFMWEYSLR